MDNNNHYFSIFLMLGTCLGLLFDNLPLFMCIGLALDLVLDKKINKVCILKYKLLFKSYIY